MHSKFLLTMKKVKEALEQAYKFYAGKGVDKDETVPQVITFFLSIDLN